MSKTLKVLGWLIGMLMVLLIAAIILIPVFVDPNDHKARIIAEVKKATGRDLRITGDIGLSLFPRFALELNGLTLSNAPGFDSGDFASVQHAEVRVNLAPLLFKQLLEVDTVQIEGVTLNLAKSKSGVANWDDMVGRKKPDEFPDIPQEPPGEGIGLLAFTIGGLSVKEANLVWDDQVTGERYEVEDIHLETGELAPGREVELSFGLTLSSRKPALKGEVELTSQLLLLPKEERLNLEGLNLQVRVSGEGLPEKGVEGLLRADLMINLEKNTLDLQDFSLASGEINFTGHMEGQDIRTTPTFEGEFKLAEFSPREWLTRFGAPLPETADPEVLQALSLSSGFKVAPGQVVLTALVVALDQTLLKGNLEILDFAAPLYLFNLDVDTINLDRYLPPSGEQDGSGRKREKTASSEEEPLFPTEALSQLRFDGTVRIGKLKVNNLHAEAIQIKVRGRDGKINLDHGIGRFYDGLLKGDVQLDVSGERPQLKMSQQASRILTGPLLLDLTGEDSLLGSGDLDLQLSSQGDSIKQLKGALNGQFSFDFRDGAVKGFNLAKMIRETKARLKGESFMVLNEPEQTDFSELTGRAIIENGVVNNQTLLAKSPYLRLEGSGKAYLLEERLNYLVRPVIVNTPAGQGGKALEELVGIPIPVKIKGHWGDPRFSIQLSKILEQQQKVRLKEKFESKVDEEVEEKLEKKLPDALHDMLRYEKLRKLF
ncbi:MAG: AsmA family protein [Candidatus Thiodiazotropha sp. (ex Epidulcina cf. delphinae)]|nr:AsmA family protein [Candidatus Thiodiazotropha sp. (ex Epidulcina cf. delphinae)]